VPRQRSTLLGVLAHSADMLRARSRRRPGLPVAFERFPGSPWITTRRLLEPRLRIAVRETDLLGGGAG
jgi:hypothetical protein